MLEAALSEERRRNTTNQHTLTQNDIRILKLDDQLKKMEEAKLAAEKSSTNSGNALKQLMSENKESLHKINLYKSNIYIYIFIYIVEIEDLLKQNDTNKQKVTDLEIVLRDNNVECERKIKLAEERIEFRDSKYESRAIVDVKRELEIYKDVHQKELDDQLEEMEYLREKADKMEKANMELRVANKTRVETDSKIRELQQENYILKVRLGEEEEKGKEMGGMKVKNRDDLQKEIDIQENLIKGYQKENETMSRQIKTIEFKYRELESLMYQENTKARVRENKLLTQTEKVLISDPQHVTLETWNALGKNNLIGINELQSLRLKIDTLTIAKKTENNKFMERERELETEISLLLKAKSDLENKIGFNYDDISQMENENKSLRNEIIQVNKRHNEELEKMEGKLLWYNENQDLIENNERIIYEKDSEIEKLKLQVKEISINKGIRLPENLIREKDTADKKVIQLQKQIKTLENALKAKDVKKIGTILQEQNMRQNSEFEELQTLRKEKLRLEKEIKEKETSYENKIRSLNQAYEKIKVKSEIPLQKGSKEGRGKSQEVSKSIIELRVKELEKEKNDLKEYYIRRIKLLEERGSKTNTGTKKSITFAGTKKKGDLDVDRDIGKENQNLNLDRIHNLEGEIDRLRIEKKEERNKVNKIREDMNNVFECSQGQFLLQILGQFSQIGKYGDAMNTQLFMETIESIIESIEESAKAAELHDLDLIHKIIDGCVELSHTLTKTNSIQIHKAKTILNKIQDYILIHMKTKLFIPHTDSADTGDGVTLFAHQRGQKAKVGKQRQDRYACDEDVVMLGEMQDEEDYWSDFSDQDYAMVLYIYIYIYTNIIIGGRRRQISNRYLI